MSGRSQRFSRRHGLARKHEGPLVYDDAPKRLRIGFLGLLEQECGMSPGTMRSVVCRELRKEPDPSNWSERPNIWEEVQQLVFKCEWYEFFDIVEAFSSGGVGQLGGSRYEDAVNQLFVEEGIGWFLVEGELEVRGEEPLEEVLKGSFHKLEKGGFEVACGELGEAWTALSRRPLPNVSGAVMHAMAALESIAREWSGNSRLTLGEIVKKQGDAFPKPVDEAVAKLWGFASEQARQERESRDLELDEAFLVVGVSATLCSYLVSKMPGKA